ncbi:hypothetical protein FA15DRAFT_675371 [Coprinopsis marcescibilis]|uniref:Uncharacterized protein n=1 Tax=Coprinopsis marcescibilis TaxID=230819 RepID=A0A5C3KDZ7_COPMA|nr:hypothetical protein FA15DRAFT_675371 [Coprinopsis marcescibilis]
MTHTFSDLAPHLYFPRHLSSFVQMSSQPSQALSAQSALDFKTFIEDCSFYLGSVIDEEETEEYWERIQKIMRENYPEETDLGHVRFQLMWAANERASITPDGDWFGLLSTYGHDESWEQQALVLRAKYLTYLATRIPKAKWVTEMPVDPEAVRLDLENKAEAMLRRARELEEDSLSARIKRLAEMRRDLGQVCTLRGYVGRLLTLADVPKRH